MWYCIGNNAIILKILGMICIQQRSRNACSTRHLKDVFSHLNSGAGIPIPFEGIGMKAPPPCRSYLPWDCMMERRIPSAETAPAVPT
jgi:hypothetical protein